MKKMDAESSEARERTTLDVRGNEKDTDELYNAAAEGCVTTLNTLLKKDPLILNEVSLTSFSETPLHIASSLGHLAFARVLVVKRPQFAKELDSLARLPLHLASAEGHVDMVKLLLDSNPEACSFGDRDGRIPLHLAAIRGRAEVLQELIDACPDSALVLLNGDSIVHLCVKYCHLEALKKLLQNDYHCQLLNSKDSNGNDILHLATMLNHLKVVEYLGSLPGVKEDAFANALNNDGCTALDVFDLGQTKDFNSFRIHKILIEIGVCRAKHENIRLPPAPASAPSRSTATAAAVAVDVNVGDGRFRTLLKKLERALEVWIKQDYIKETHGNLVIVATVIATMCFAAVMNPPGGVWQQDTTSGLTCGSGTELCIAGTPVLSYGETQEAYYYFLYVNSLAFVLSLGIIIMHFGVFPLNTKAAALFISVVMWYILSCLQKVYTKGYELLNRTVYAIDKSGRWRNVSWIWFALLWYVVYFHTYRIVYWFLHEHGFIKRVWPWLRDYIDIILVTICAVSVCWTLH